MPRRGTSPRGEHERAAETSGRAYAGLLRAYPREVRDEYGDEMARLFRDLCREELRERGRGGLLLLWVRTLPELLRTALNERGTMLAKNAYLPVPPTVAARWGAISALLGGVLGAGSYLVGVPASVQLQFVVLLVAALLCVLGLLGLYGALAAPSGRAGRLASAGAVLATVSAGSWLAVGAFAAFGLAWGWAVGPTQVAAGAGLLCWFASLLLLGTAAVKTRLPGRLRFLPLAVAALVPASLALSVLVAPFGFFPQFSALPFLGTGLLGLALLRGPVRAAGAATASGAATGRSAFGRLTGRPRTSAAQAAGEKELLGAIRRRGSVGPAGAALETSLSVSEAERVLSKLASEGHIEVRAEGGRLRYYLWEGDG